MTSQAGALAACQSAQSRLTLTQKNGAGMTLERPRFACADLYLLASLPTQSTVHYHLALASQALGLWQQIPLLHSEHWGWKRILHWLLQLRLHM